MPPFAIDRLSAEERLSFSQSILLMLEQWGAKTSGQITILGLPEKTGARTMLQYKKNIPLPNEPVVLERIEHLVGIADALRTTYPTNARMGAIWMNKPNRMLQDRTPLDTMVEDGLDGLLAVRAHLDCAFDWRENGS